MAPLGQIDYPIMYQFASETEKTRSEPDASHAQPARAHPKSCGVSLPARIAPFSLHPCGQSSAHRNLQRQISKNPRVVAQAKLVALTQKPAVQRSAHGYAAALPSSLANFDTSAGQELPEPVRQKMEAFFSTSFADVRVHVGSHARSINALAFTQGTNVHFAPGQYNPDSAPGQKLLGHELAHVVQQRAGRVRNPLGTGIAVVQNRALEAEADRMGNQAAASVPTTQVPARCAPAGVTAHTTSLPSGSKVVKSAVAGCVQPLAASQVIQLKQEFFHWMPTDSPSVKTAVESKKMQAWQANKAFWVFDLRQEYRPSMSKNHTLIVYILDDTAGTNIKSTGTDKNGVPLQIDAEDGYEIKATNPKEKPEHHRYRGETKHPRHIIVKSNERGAYGIGQDRLRIIAQHVEDVRYATRKEVAKALGKDEREVDAFKPKGAIGW